MALRKFVFINSSEGFSQEQGASDELSLGKITFLGVEGVAIDAGSASIVNVADGVSANDAVNKGQLEQVETDYQAADAVVLDSAESYTDGRETQMRTDWAADDATTLASAESYADGLDAQLRLDFAAADASTLASAESYADGLDAQLRLDFAAADASTLASAESYADGLDAQVRLDFASADASTLASAQSYADSLLAGFTVKAPVKAATTANITLSGEQTIDDIALVAGDRILVKNQTNATQNGIYVVAAGAWSRAADADSDAEVKDGLSVFVEQGTENADDTFVLITNNAITLGTSELTFQKFSGIGQVTAGDGLSKTGDTLAVNVGDGIAIVSDAVAIDLATDPGLQFTANKLDLKLDANGALSKDSDGLKAVSANADRLSVSSSGLDVVGLPSEFKINGESVSADVTATNLNALTDYGLTYIHRHNNLTDNMVSAAAIDSTMAVYFSANGKVSAASCSTAAQARVVGIAVTAAMGADEAIEVVKNGLCVGAIAGMGLSAGTPVYLGASGYPVVFGDLVSGDRIIRLGFAKDDNDIEVMIQDMGQKA